MIKGSITIYLLLSLTLVLAVICTLTESARTECINAKLRGITYMAADSCFAEYASEIFDDYGIMALWKNDPELIASFNGYISRNLDFSDLGMYMDADLYLMQHETSALGEVVRLTDRQGMPFNMQVYEYMDYFLVREALEEFLSYIDIYRTGNAAAAFLAKICEYSDTFIKVADSAAKIQRTVDKVKSLAYNPRSILGDMEYGLRKYLETDDASYISWFNSGYWDLKGHKNTLKRYTQQICEQTGVFYDRSEEAGKALTDMQELLDSQGEDFDEELRQAFQGQIDDLLLKTSDKEADYYAIGENSRIAGNIHDKLDSLDYLLAYTSTKDAAENAEKYLGYVRSYLAYFNDADTDDLGLNMQEYPGRKQNAGFLSVISSLFSEGLLKAVAGGSISKKKISTDGLPSALRGNSSGGSYHAAGLSGPWRTLEFGEYVISHFGCFTSASKENVLEYETEYVIAGQPSDRENLQKTAEKLLLMRAGLNAASFMKDMHKMEEAEILAQSVIGFTGMELLVQMVKLVIICLWCIAEALCDVKALMAGKRVPVLKESNNWAVSAANLTSFRRSLLPAVTDEAGLSYEDHLRILLYLENGRNRTFRTMDLIQANACRKYNSAFRMDECIASASVYAVFSARPLFTLFGFVRNIAGNSSGRYSFRYTQEYAYTQAADLNGSVS